MQKHREEIHKLYEYYNSKENLVARYGNADSPFVKREMEDLLMMKKDSELTDSQKFLSKKMETMFLDANHIPLNENLVPKRKGKHDLSVYAEARRAIDKWDKSLERSVNSFESFARTPSAIYRKNPTTIEFNNKISSILNAERKHKSYYIYSLRDISKGITNVMSIVNNKDGSYSKISNKIDKLYTQISKAEANRDNEKASQYVHELYKVMNSDDSKRVLETFVDMTENLTFEQLNDPKQLNLNDKNGNPYDRQVIQSLINPVKEAKALLNNMGKINLKGLQKMKDVTSKLYGKAPSYKRDAINKNIDMAIERVEVGMKEGRYFPHYAIQRMLDIESVIDNIDASKLYKDESYQNQVLDNIESAVRNLPGEVMSTSMTKRNFFVKDPVRVLETYALNAATFNKKQFLMDAYLTALVDLRPSKADFDGLSQMAEYISAKYMGTAKGHYEASDFVKETSSTIAKLQTLSKMGLSLTGAIRNSTQQFWYTLYTGIRNYRHGQSLLDSKHTYTYDVVSKDGEIRSVKELSLNNIMDRVSEESGYFFDKASMETISKGALANINKENIKYAVDKDGNPYVEVNSDGIWRKVDAKLSEFTGKGLYFHQLTENIVRENVYRNAFAQHFDMLFRNETYKQGEAQKEAERLGISIDDAMKRVHASIEKQAHNMALNWVRMTQFEYSQPDRPMGFGGGTGNMSAIGNALFQFFPYAAHMFEMNSRVWSEGLRAGFRGDFNSWKFGALARMIGFQTFGIGLVSIVLNNEFRYLIENDTYSRLTDLYNLFTSENPTEKTFGNGLVSLLSGPAVSDMLFWMEAAGFTDFSQSEMQQLMFGYYNLEQSAQSDRERMMINRISVSGAKIFKSRESFVNGDITGIIRNNFLLYPSEFTKKGHQQMLDIMGIESSRSKRKKQEEQFNSTLLNLPEDQRQKMLEVVRSINERNQVDRGIPVGLENLTIR